MPLFIFYLKGCYEEKNLNGKYDEKNPESYFK